MQKLISRGIGLGAHQHRVGFSLGFGDRGLTAAASPAELLKAQGLPDSLLALIEKRAALRRDAYVSAAGHKRPGVAAGLPIAEAEKQADVLTAEIKRAAAVTD